MTCVMTRATVGGGAAAEAERGNPPQAGAAQIGTALPTSYLRLEGKAADAVRPPPGPPHRPHHP
jgi:hypothetical protein